MQVEKATNRMLPGKKGRLSGPGLIKGMDAHVLKVAQGGRGSPNAKKGAQWKGSRTIGGGSWLPRRSLFWPGIN